LDLAEEHQSVGDIRGIGLHQVIELVKDKKSRDPLGNYNQPLSEPMQVVAQNLRQNGMSTFVKWNWIFCCPPLIISEAQIQDGINIIDNALKEADSFC
jgi:taurine--2-oxoglutarate transaminase